MFDCICGNSRNIGDRNAIRVRVQFNSAVQRQGDVSQFLDNVVVKAQIFGIKATQLKRMGECIYERFSSLSCIAMHEFMSICQEHWTGISENEWERFASTFILECFQTRVKEEKVRLWLIRIATCFAHSMRNDDESAQSSVCAVMNMAFEESTLDTSDDSNQNHSDSFWSCTDLMDDSSFGFPTENEFFMGTYEDASVMAHERLEQVDTDSSCYAVKHTYICLKDVNGSSTEDENCVSSSYDSWTHNGCYTVANCKNFGYRS